MNYQVISYDILLGAIKMHSLHEMVETTRNNVI